MKIPKTLFLYWGGESLSWLRYLTVYSFHKFNPEWKIKVYYPVELSDKQPWDTNEQTLKYTGEDWWPELKEIPNVEILPFDMSKVGLFNSFAEVHKSDIFRIWALYEFGGFYSDMDILYYAPLELGNEELVLSYDVDNLHYNVGFLGAVKGHKIYRDLLVLVKSTDQDTYQRFGSELWKTYFTSPTWQTDPSVLNLPYSFVYHFNWQEAKKLFEKGDFERTGIGIHWFGGAPEYGVWQDKLTPKTYNDYDILISKAIGYVFASNPA